MRYLPAVVCLLLCAAVPACAAPPFVTPATVPAPLEESDKDNLNVWQNVPEYASVKPAGGRVLLSAEPRTFMVAWVPEGFAKQETRRVLVVLHPLTGQAYAGFRAALPAARRHGYAVLAVQWWVGPDEHLGPRTVYDLVHRGLGYMREKWRVTPHAAALVATGRAATYAYEMAYWDRKLATDHFAVVVCNSGGVHPETPSPLLRKIRDGDLGDEPYAGVHFFLYAGLKDDPPGDAPRLEEAMKAAKALVEGSGDTVDAFVIDAEARAADFRLGKGPGEDAVKLFVSLTERGAAPPATAGGGSP